MYRGILELGISTYLAFWGLWATSWPCTRATTFFSPRGSIVPWWCVSTCRSDGGGVRWVRKVQWSLSLAARKTAAWTAWTTRLTVQCLCPSEIWSGYCTASVPTNRSTTRRWIAKPEDLTFRRILVGTNGLMLFFPVPHFWI